jgi:signal transduction histidine kinase
MAVGEREVTAGCWVVVTVSDTGCGIPPELLDRVVEPFFTTKAHDESAGLGLSVVHVLVSSAGGAMRLRSTPRHWTSVDVFLPVRVDG